MRVSETKIRSRI
uniref:Uncharacterized protein n=1 Tax=Rhizophora mucronata TaxID=61149 RepID=A0A2P2QF88_RHIMU